MTRIAHISDNLVRLGDSCSPIALPEVNGWTLDQWELVDSEVEQLLEMYRDLIVPAIASQILDMLESEGVDIEEIFTDEEAADDTTTRADLVELAGAAAVVGVEGVDVHALHLPNVPKGSRAYSSRGIDIVGAPVEAGSKVVDFAHGPLVVCSVKHTVADAGDLRRKLVTSIDDAHLSIPYLVSQLRVLHGRLAERGINGDAVFEAVIGYPSSPKVLVQLVGATAHDHADDFQRQLGSLPEANEALRHCRHIVIDSLGHIHQEMV